MILINGKKTLKYTTLGAIILLGTMIATTPTKESLNKWVLKEYSISCKYDQNMGQICYKDEKQITSRSSHYKNAALFSSYELKYRYHNGEYERFRTIGILGMRFKMKEGALWDVLN